VSTRPDISVVAPARDSERCLPDLLGALESQTLPTERFEVIIVDDGSRDRTAELVADWASRDQGRRCLVRGFGGGPAQARNLGIRVARGEWVAFTDSDTIPDPDWLEAGLDAVQRLGVDALEGAIYSGTEDAIGPYTGKVVNLQGGIFMTANMIFLRRLLIEVGGFDERFEMPSAEDRELSLRILAAGHQIPFAPDVRVRHPVVPRSPVDLLRQTRRFSYFGLVWAKHPEMSKAERDVIRVLNHVDIDILLTWLGLASLRRTTGFGRLALSLFVANGLRRAAGSGGVFRGPPEEAAARAAIAMTLPVVKAIRCLQGAVRYRTFYW
jgi:glycosyltransferase involved in cell wall biosynthesis